jgi:hypothetical protein
MKMNIKKPNRQKHSYTQQLHAPPERVFPLLCPVREVDWAPGWMPEIVLSESAVCEPECIFVTPPEFDSEPSNSIWVVTKHDPDNWAVEMYKVAPGHTVSKLEIALEAKGESSTAAHISYEITAIGAPGDEFMKEFTEKWYEAFMIDWEKAMNHYLDTGSIIA